MEISADAPRPIDVGPGSGLASGVLLALTLVTGIVDAAAFLALGQVFAAMQTGNVIFLGFGLADAGTGDVVAPLVGLVSFLAGSTLAVVLALPAAMRGPRGLGLTLILEAALLTVTALVAIALDPAKDDAGAYVLIGLLSLTMAMRNTMVRRDGGQNLATTVVNLTFISHLPGAHPSLASAGDVSRRAGAVIAVLIGAAGGALLLKSSLALPIFAAAVISFGSGLLWLRATTELRLQRRNQPR